MQLITDLLKDSSLYNIKRIVEQVEDDPELIKDLVKFALGKNPSISMRAAWALTHCHDAMPELIQPYLKELILACPDLPHTGTRRSLLRILANENIPDDLQVFIFDHCLNWVISKKEPIAVKAFAMDILTNIALQEPDLKNEVIPVILDILPNGTMGIKSRGKKALKKLGWEDHDF